VNSLPVFDILIIPWKDCPEVVVGRVAYDNWLVLNANKRRHTTIDATRTLLALHQTTKKGNGEGRSHPNAHPHAVNSLPVFDILIIFS
jgi:hypothetical protein